MPLNAAWYYSQCVERPYYPCAVLSPYSCINETAARQETPLRECAGIIKNDTHRGLPR